MFPSAPDTRPARARWRAGVRRLADLAVAFATLDDPELDRMAELEDLEDGPGGHAADTHPHRVPLRHAGRPGRPGMVPTPRVACAEPLPRGRSRARSHAPHALR